MTESTNTPRIRFKGYTEAWEQRKLWSLTIWDKYFNEVEKEKQPRVIKYPYVLADVFKKIEDNTGDIRLLSTGNYIGYTTKELAGTNLCEGEIVAIPWGGTPNIKYFKGKFVTADNRIATSNNTLVLSNRYLYLWMQSQLKYLESLYRGASIQHPSMGDVLDMEISLPPIKEQESIAKILFTFDNLITLHQRKYDKLVSVKRSLLEKMFPQDGQTAPKIRFKGFTEAWEQRKLSVISNKVIEKNTLREFTETLTNSAEFGIISQRDFFDHDITNKANLNGYYIVANNDFVYNPRISTTAPVGPVNRNKLGRNGVMSPLYTVFRPNNVDFTYLEWFFKNGLWYAYMRFNGDSGARSDRFSIKDDVFFDMPISTPSLPEQKAIGELLNNLDNLITLHQRKLEKLKNIKKSLLEKMFV